ncbi:MAG: lysylphosphatidylglycerol synthase transmembrane domain-containing protein [Spirochaetota bacterium]
MKRALLFVGISVVSIGAILAVTYDPQTIDAIRGFDLRYLALLALVWFVAVSGSALSFFALARATESRLGPGAAYKSAVLRILGNLITPFSFGGGPFAVFYMSERGVPSGKGSSVVVTQMMVVSTYILIASLGAFLYLRDDLFARPVLLTIFAVAGAIQLAGVAVTLLILVYPHAAIRLITGVGHLLARFRIVKRVDRFKRRVIHDGSVARRSFRRYFTHHPLKFLLGAIGVLIMYLGELALLWVIFSGLGYSMSFIDGMAMGALFYLTLSYIPTPGSSGVGEGVFVAIFAGLIPRHALGIAVLLWRFFYSYVGSALGAVTASHHFTFRKVVEEAGLPDSKERSA